MMQKDNFAEWQDSIRLFLTGGLLLALVFLTPDAGQQEQKSFFAVADASTWGQFGELPLAWCSLKIILFGIGAMLVMSMPLRLAYHRTAIILSTLFLILAVMAILLSMFGVYELAKAVF